MLKTNDFFVEVCSEVVFDGDAQQYERDCALDAAQQAVADVDLFAAARSDAYFAAKRVLANEAARMRDLQVIVARVLKKAAARPAPGLATATATVGATSGQTAAAQHTSTGGSDDDPDPAPAVQIIDPETPEFVKGTRAYNNRLASAARAKKIEKLAAQGVAYKAMDLAPSLGNCDAGIGHESILPPLSRAQVDPDPLDQIIPDPYKAAAETLNAAGENQQRPYHRFLRKAILAMRNPLASPAQKVLSDQYLIMAMPGLAAVVRAYYRKLDIRGVDVDGTVQHLVQKICQDADFDDQPNPNAPGILDGNAQTINQAITFSNFSVESASHQDAARFTERPAADDDDDEGPDPLDKAVHQQHSRQRDQDVRELRGDSLDPTILALHDNLRAESDLPTPEDACGDDDDIEGLAAPEAHEETSAVRRARQTDDELRASTLKHRLLTGLRDLPVGQRDVEIQVVARHMAQHPDPMLLTMLYNDVQGKKKAARDPVTVALHAAVFKAVRFSPAEALFAPKPQEEAGGLDLDGALALYAGLPLEDCRARAQETMSALCGLLDDTRQHVVGALQTRAANRQGRYSPTIQRAATTLLEGAGYPA